MLHIDFLFFCHLCGQFFRFQISNFFQTQKTVYTTQSIEECKENFKKVCWIDMQDKVSSETIRICTTRPEKVCDSQLARELAEKGSHTNNKRCKLFYESGMKYAVG